MNPFRIFIKTTHYTERFLSPRYKVFPAQTSIKPFLHITTLSQQFHYHTCHPNLPNTRARNPFSIIRPPYRIYYIYNTHTFAISYGDWLTGGVSVINLYEFIVCTYAYIYRFRDMYRAHARTRFRGSRPGSLIMTAARARDREDRFSRLVDTHTLSVYVCVIMEWR